MIAFGNNGGSNNSHEIIGTSLAQQDPASLQTMLDLADQKGLQAYRRQIPITGNKFDWEIGWWYGALVSDGWITGRTIGYTKLNDVKRKTFVQIARKIAGDKVTVREYSDEGNASNKLGPSIKVHLKSPGLSRVVFCCNHPRRNEEKEATRNALQKMIPTEILHGGSRECLLGLLAGLLEGDGTLTWNKFTGKPRPTIRFSTSSPYLVADIKVLGQYFGVRVGDTTIPARGWSNTAYALCFSIPDMWRLGSEMRFVTAPANDFWQEFIERPEPLNRLNIVPISQEEATFLMQHHPTGGKLYTQAASARKSGRVTRKLADELLAGVPLGSCPLLETCVAAEDVGWQIRQSESDN